MMKQGVSIPFKLSASVLLGLILLATWLRWWQLDTIPPGFWFDEAYNAMDAIWMAETSTWTVFLPGNHGREALYHYLLLVSTTFLGATPYAVRFVSTLLGILLVPLMARWARSIFTDHPQTHWIVLISTAGLVVAPWVLIMNRAGYRANLLPLFVCWACYSFWRGWQTDRFRHYLLAGIALGLCQYTYTSARLLPLVFGLFTLIQTPLLWSGHRAQLKGLWSGLFLMIVSSVVITAPLLFYAFNNPAIFWGRTADVAVAVDGSWQSLKMFGLHLIAAVRIFIDGYDPNWRHQFVGQPGFHGFSSIGFWIGLLVIIFRWRQANHLLILLVLIVMWLPAALADPPFHTLRLAGVLPAYYVIMAVGFVTITGWITRRTSLPFTSNQMGSVVLILLLVINGTLTIYTYFYRWPTTPQVYQAFDGSLVELANRLTQSEESINVVIPFYLYNHAAVRYILHQRFEEEVLLPAEAHERLTQDGPKTLIIPQDLPDDGEPPAYVWLVSDSQSGGKAFVSTVNRDLPPAALSGDPQAVIYNRQGQPIARQYALAESDQLETLFVRHLPRKQINATWADNLRLTGFEFVPEVIGPTDTTNLYLSWEVLALTSLQEKMFLQLLDSQGQPVGQQELDPISKKMYRWRPDGLVLEQYPLKLDANLPAGLYFVRLGFFNPKTEQRLIAYGPDSQPLGSEVIIGPLTVAEDKNNPYNIQHYTQASLGGVIELLGYSIKSAPTRGETDVELYWRAEDTIDLDYTAFVQLLDEERNVVAQQDMQPLNGLYPTSRWRPGDVIATTFVLAVPQIEDGGSHRLVTGMYHLETGTRLPTFNHANELLTDNLIPLQ